MLVRLYSAYRSRIMPQRLRLTFEGMPESGLEFTPKPNYGRLREYFEGDKAVFRYDSVVGKGGLQNPA